MLYPFRARVFPVKPVSAKAKMVENALLNTLKPARHAGENGQPLAHNEIFGCDSALYFETVRLSTLNFLGWPLRPPPTLGLPLRHFMLVGCVKFAASVNVHNSFFECV